MNKDFQILEDYEALIKSKIIIYGTGARGRRLLRLLEKIDCNILYMCDSDIKKKRKKVLNKEICHISDLTSIIDKDTLVVIASAYFNDILNDLLKIIPDNRICSMFSVELSIYFNYQNNKFSNKPIIESYLKELLELGIKNIHKSNKMEMLECYLDIFNQAVLIYSVGKVGSTTLVDSICQYGIFASHCHELSSLPIVNSDKKLNTYKKEAINNFHGKIIIPIREPVARDISQYFQLLKAHFQVLINDYDINSLYGGFIKIYWESLVNETNYNMNSGIQNTLLNNVDKGPEFDWFDWELKRNFGFDIYSEKFNQEEGYSIYNLKNEVELMVIQLEKMNNLEIIIGKFLGIPEFKLLKSNYGSMKEYDFIYQEFKKKIQFPKEYLDFYYQNNKGMNHFYSKEQQKVFYNKWLTHSI